MAGLIRCNDLERVASGEFIAFGPNCGGRDDVTREGQAQQDKAEAQRDAAKKEAEAEAARGSAKVAEERQKSNQ